MDNQEAQNISLAQALEIIANLRRELFFTKNQKLTNDNIIKKAYEKLKQTQDALEIKNIQLIENEKDLRKNLAEMYFIQQMLNKQNAKLEQQNQNIITNINYAKKIQAAILHNHTLKYALPHQNFLICKPKEIISGDFLWFSTHPTGILLGIIDCTGHGLSGALMTLITHNILNQIIYEKNILNPAEILNNLAQIIEAKLNSQKDINPDGIDAGFVFISTSKGDMPINIQYAGAKHALFGSHNGDFFEIKGDRQSIGRQMDNQNYTLHEIKLFHNDNLYMFSDGFPDQPNPQRIAFSKERIRNIIRNNHLATMDQQEGLFNEALTKYQAYTDQRDDIIILGLKLTQLNS